MMMIFIFCDVISNVGLHCSSDGNTSSNGRFIDDGWSSFVITLFSTLRSDLYCFCDNISFCRIFIDDGESTSTIMILFCDVILYVDLHGS